MPESKTRARGAGAAADDCHGECPDERDVIVVVAATPWCGMPSSERQLTSELARHKSILWVDPPRSLLRAERPGRVRTRLTALEDELWLLSPVTLPGVTRPGARALAAGQRRRATRRALAQLGRRAEAVLVAGLDDALDVCPGAVRIFYGTDDYVAGAELMGVSRRASRRAERRQLARADVVIAVSEVLAQRWAGPGRTPQVIPNGVDPTLFAGDGPPADVPLPRPVAGFVGHLNDRIDVDLLLAVARRGVSLLLVGPLTRAGRSEGLDELLALPNVHATGLRSHEDLPGLYRAMDVGLTPYRDDDFNRASFPLKTLEYLAAGLPVVSTDLPASRHLDSALLRLAVGPERFADEVVLAVAEAPDPDLRSARRALAQEHSWERRAQQVLRAAGLSAPAVQGRQAPLTRAGTP